MEKKKISFDKLQKQLKESNATWQAAENTGNTNERGLGYTPGPNDPSLKEREKISRKNSKQEKQTGK